MSLAYRSGTIIRIEDMGIYSFKLKQLRTEIPRLMRDSVEDALTNGESEILADIWNRTPQSDRYRYAFRYKAIDLQDWKKDGSSLKSGWRKNFSEGQLNRLDQYGQQRLRKSLFGGQDTYGIKGMTVKSDQHRASFTLSSDLPYARRMHEAVDIVDYWSGTEKGIGDKKGRGWSTVGTGAKFLTDPVHEKKMQIRNDVANALAYRLEELMR